MKPSEYEDIGQYLRESRESLRITLSQAADSLHIRVKYLEALEAGDLGGLPGKSYTRGYIRNYAHYLRLNVEEVLEAYSGVLGPKISEIFIPEQTLQKHLPTSWLIWLTIAGFALLYGCWYFRFHDRTEIGKMVGELPASLVQLLDKRALAAMDKAWKTCLDGEDAVCVMALRSGVLMPRYMSVYDIRFANQPPSKP
jgi:transcriptional regulator with XRE-family HTH domain